MTKNINSKNKVVSNEKINNTDVNNIPDVHDANDITNISNSNRRNVKFNTKFIEYNYQIIQKNGEKFKGIIEATSRDDAIKFLQKEGYKVLSVEPKKAYDIDISLHKKMDDGELSFMLTQLATYLKAGISLVDSVRILAKQTTKKEKRKIYDKLTYSLLIGLNFSEALELQSNIFPRMLINMVKTAEKTGDLVSILNDMSDYYHTSYQTKKEMKSALAYPVVVTIFAILVAAFMLGYIVPQFEKMYTSQGAKLPGLTKAILKASKFLTSNYVLIIIILVVLLLAYHYTFKNIKSFRKAMQSFSLKIPFFGKIIMYNEVTMFTKTFGSLINHGVLISECMDILGQISDNEVYKTMINESLENLSKGVPVSKSFEGKKVFPIVAYEMIVTGENTGQLGVMMDKVAVHFGELHKNMIAQMKSMIEPILIVFLAFVVGIIILSLVQPMFGIYNTYL